VLRVKNYSMSIISAFTILLIDTKVDNLNNAWQVGPPIIVNTAIFLQGALCVSLKDLIAFNLLEAIVDFIAILAFLKDGVELEVNRLAGNQFPF
jgi:hypothetical protein